MTGSDYKSLILSSNPIAICREMNREFVKVETLFPGKKQTFDLA